MVKHYFSFLQSFIISFLPILLLEVLLEQLPGPGEGAVEQLQGAMPGPPQRHGPRDR